MDPIERKEAILAAWRDLVRSEDRTASGPVPLRDYVYATGRRDCLRWSALDLRHPEEREVLTDDALERFARGDERETSISIRLQKAGLRCRPPFRVVEAQKRFQILDRSGRVIIVGRIDGRLAFDDGVRPVFDVKSGRVYETATSIEALDRTYARKDVDQMLAYLYAESEPFGLLVGDRRGIPNFIVVELEPNLARVEEFLREAEIAVDVRFGRRSLSELPFQTDARVCRRCPHYGRSCSPPSLSAGEGAYVVDDAVWIDEIRQYLEDREAADRFEYARKMQSERLRQILRGEVRDVDLVVGPYLVKARKVERVGSKRPDGTRGPVTSYLRISYEEIPR